MTEKVTDLMRQLSSSTDAPERVEILRLLAKEYLTLNPAKGRTHAQEALELARQNQLGQDVIADLLCILCGLNEHTGDFASALSQALSAQSIFNEIDDPAGQARALHLLSGVCMELGDYPQALDSALKSLNQYSELAEAAGQLRALNNLGIIYNRLGEYKKELGTYQQALQIAREIEHPKNESVLLNNIAMAHLSMEAYEYALQHAEDCLTLAKEIGFAALESNVVSTLGDICRKMGNYSRAERLFAQSLDLSRQQGQGYLEMYNLLSIGKLALSREQYENSIAQLEAALELAETLQTKSEITEIHHALSRAHEQQGDFESALDHHQSFHEIKESLFNAESDQKLKNLQIIHDTETAKREARLSAAALKESQSRFRVIFENSPLGIIVISPKAKILEVNNAFAEMLGFKDTELLEMNVNELTYPEDIQEVAKVIKEVITENLDSFSLQYRLMTKSEGSIWVKFTGAMLYAENGQLAFGVGIAEDVTKSRLADQKLHNLAAELERSNEDLAQFAYIASHDLKEPLRKVQAFGERLNTNYAIKLDARGQDFIFRMQDAANRGLRMVDALLSYSRVTTRGQAFVPTDLNQVVSDVLCDLEVRLEESQGEIRVGKLPIIAADAVQMQQLFQNLVSNALKFHKPGTSPTVTITAIDGNSDQVQIRVADHGIGFDEKFKERIFQPFQRLHGQSEYEGSGIGLSVCRKIVERHSGSIVAQSVPGEGTTIIINLPKTQISSAQ